MTPTPLMKQLVLLQLPLILPKSLELLILKPLSPLLLPLLMPPQPLMLLLLMLLLLLILKLLLLLQSRLRLRQKLALILIPLAPTLISELNVVAKAKQTVLRIIANGTIKRNLRQLGPKYVPTMKLPCKMRQKYIHAAK